MQYCGLVVDPHLRMPRKITALAIRAGHQCRYRSMPTRKTVVRFLLLFVVAIAANFTVIFYYGVPETTEREFREKIHRQADIIARLKRNLTRLQHKLETLQNSTASTNRKYSNGVASRERKVPPIYMITPTYARWTQKADLTRLGQTLMHVPNLHWIVVEDSEEKTALVANLLQRHSNMLRSTHLNIRTAESRRLKEGEPVWHKNRGVEQRNLALQWIRKSAADGLLEGGERGVVYFGDDDNTYDIQIFEEMRYTKAVSVWLVGISGGLRFEGPVCHGNRVTGWYTMWGFERAFQIDMAGFAVSLRLLLDHPDALIDAHAPRGYLETSLLEQLVTLEQLEPRGDNCTKVLVWHTRTEVPKMKHEDRLVEKKRPSDPNIET